MLDELLRIFLVIAFRIWNNKMDHGSTIINVSTHIIWKLRDFGFFCDRLLAWMKVLVWIKPYCSSNYQWWWICVIFPKEDCIRWDSSSCCCHEQLGKWFDIVFHQSKFNLFSDLTFLMLGREEKESNITQ